MKLLMLAAGTSVLALAASPVFAQANLITNGSFEQPVYNGLNQIIPGNDSTSIPGWTTTRNGVERFDPLIYAVGTAPDGSIVIDICPFTYTGGGITQSFATVAGDAYQLRFYAATSNAYGRTGDAIVSVSVGDVTQSLSLVNRQNAAVWNLYSIDFTASATRTTLTFDNVQDGNTHFAFIDGVVVASATAPEPGSMGLLVGALLPLGGFLRCRRKL